MVLKILFALFSTLGIIGTWKVNDKYNTAASATLFGVAEFLALSVADEPLVAVGVTALALLATIATILFAKPARSEAAAMLVAVFPALVGLAAVVLWLYGAFLALASNTKA